ncbi:MAG: PIG-L deacetylase family protein [Actinomycetales bacterium]
MPHTVVAFHAHPDDEALLTAGTMARLAAEGHRVVLVVATDGAAGLTSSALVQDLAERRRHELASSANVLGVARVVDLGYGDSGLDGQGTSSTTGEASTGEDGDGGTAARTPFAKVDPEAAAAKLADVLREERADVLLTYDPSGGYGHPDHVQVHRVGLRAAELAATPVVLEATVDRDLVLRALRLARRLYRFPAEFDPAAFERSYLPRSEITHRVSVWRHAGAKRASMAAHASQAAADGGDRTLAAFLRIPRPVYDVVFGREWYRQVRPAYRGTVTGDVFAGLADGRGEDLR